jgi:hypothetical protein
MKKPADEGGLLPETSELTSKQQHRSSGHRLMVVMKVVDENHEITV